MRDLRVSFPKPCDERWEAMAPVGCARICAQCDKAVHDLSKYELEDVEELLRRDAEICVRASIDADGMVALKPGRRDSSRRMVLAVAAMAGLLTAQPALAGGDRPQGAVAGRVEAFGLRMRVIATDGSGRTFGARVRRDGRYRIGHLPAGTYTLTFVPDCGESWTVENIIVGAGETIVPDPQHPGGCIVVGLLRIEDPGG
jgi:hypothetical protein